MLFGRFFDLGLYAVVKAIDPWAEGSNEYVCRYRSRLDEVAKKMSSLRGETITTRFNVRESCAEFVAGGEVIASVTMNGDVGSAYETVVTAKTFLIDECKLFTQAILPKVRFVPT